MESAADHSFATRLLRWFDREGRHELPWQHPRTPYRVWVAEVMLQQTRVQTVIPYYQRFLARFPDLRALASAPLDEVLAVWSGLGYYSRARNLHAAAQRCMAEYGGALPAEVDVLAALPGIGRSTAAAILAQAYGQRLAVLDGNVQRVLSRWRAIDGVPQEAAVRRRLWALAESLLPTARLADYTQALMDLGATVCTRRSPNCRRCPLAADCHALAQNAVDRFPAARARRERPLKRTRMLLARDGKGRLLLEQRPARGIWGGLWSLPEQSAELGMDPDGGRLGQVLRHEFTHYSLYIELWAVPPAAVAEIAGRWFVPEEALGLGLPQPVRRIVEALLRGDEVKMRTVNCVRYGPGEEALDRAPWPGELGQRLLASVGKRAWGEWLAHQTLLINEHRLSPLDPKTRAFLAAELEKYFFGGGSAVPAGYQPQDPG
jgi:A/G-specific adenine glycosylase